MSRLLCDENLGRTVVAILVEAGLDAVAWRDVGRRGASDTEILASAVADERALVTRDLDFSDIYAFPIGSHAGIVVCRFPFAVSAILLGRALARGLRLVSARELRGNLCILEPGDRIRLRVQEDR